MHLSTSRIPVSSEGVARRPERRYRRRAMALGFTLFELILVVILVGLFSGILLHRFQIYQELAEKAAMEQTAGSVQSALNIQLAGLIARGRTEDIPRLLDVNPMKFLVDRQKNYVGEFFEVRDGDVDAGNWYFDLKHKELVYRVFRGAHFVAGKEGEKTVRYKVSLAYNEDIIAPSGRKREIGGVVLRTVRPYNWEIR